MEEEYNVNKIAAEVIIKLSASMADKCLKISRKYCKDLINRAQIDIGTAYAEYLEFSYNNINKVKTILYRDSGKPLYSFYECVGVRQGSEIINTVSVNYIFEKGNFILITGTGGTGKTIMLKHFFLNCINDTEYIPVLVNVRCVNDVDVSGKNIIDIIYEEMKDYHFNLEKEYLEYSLYSGNYLFLFDGFDEISGERDTWMENEIIKLCKRYPDNHYIMTSRPSERFVGWNDFIELKAIPLTKEQAMSMINKIDYDINVKKEFYKALNNGLYVKYKSFASNPLLLTIMLMTFENNAELPEKLNDFYEQAFLTLFSKHDAYKNMYRREIKSNLSYADFKKMFSCFCFLTYLKRRFELKEHEALAFIESAKELSGIQKDIDARSYLDDLVHFVCMLIQDGWVLSYSHRSFQEYFAAVYISTLPDEDQKQLIEKMIHKINIQIDNIIYFLYDQQPERFIKNIMYPNLVKWKKEIEEVGHLEFLITKFSGLSYSDRNIGKAFLGIRLKDENYSLFRDMMQKINKFTENNGSTYITYTEGNRQNIIKYFQFRKVGFESFLNLKHTIIWEDVTKFMEYWVNDLKNMMKYLDEYEKKAYSNIGKFDNLFD